MRGNIVISVLISVLLCGSWESYAADNIRPDVILRSTGEKYVRASVRKEPLGCENSPGVRPPLLNKGKRMSNAIESGVPMASAAQVAAELNASGLLLKTGSWDFNSDTQRQGFYNVPLGGTTPTGFTLQMDLSALPWSVFGVWSSVYSPEGYYLSLPEYVKGQIPGMFHYIIDTDTWSIRRQWHTEDNNLWVNSSAYDPTSGVVYAQMTKADEHYNYFGTFNVADGTSKIIKVEQYSDNMYSVYEIAFTSDGQLWGLYVARNNDGSMPLSLVKIDKFTGTMNVVGQTDLPDYSVLGSVKMVASKDESGFYIMTEGSYMTNGSLYFLDAKSCKATKIYDTPDGESFRTLFVPQSAAGDVPEEVSNITAGFTDDSLSGTVSFTMPTKTVSGETITEELEYEMVFNSTHKQQGKAAAGQTVTVSVTLPSSAMYTIGIRTKNVNGYSLVAKKDVFIGADVPASIGKVTATYSDGTFTISWDEPGSLEGGYFDASQLKYTVVSYPEFNVVATNISERTTTFAVTEPSDGFKRYYFLVSPVYKNQTYGGSGSNVVTIGNMTLPWTSDFGTNDNGFAYVNANGDHRKWTHSTTWGYLYLDGNETEPADDWVICPPTKMEVGKAYRVNFNLHCRMNEHPEKYSIWAGNDSTLTALTTCLVEETTFNNESADYWAHAYFSPKTAGKYHFALRCTSGAQLSTLYITEANIEEPVSATLAAEPAFTLTRSEDGALKAILDFVVPSVNLAGDPLDKIEKVTINRDGELIETMTGLTPGQAVHWEDTTVPKNGTYTYEVTPWTEEGAGITAVRTTFIGMYVPMELKSLTVNYASDTGRFLLKWDSDPIDVAGQPFDASQLVYNVYVNEGEKQVAVAENLKAKQLYHRICKADDEQRLVYFGVAPVNTAGEGWGTMSDPMFAGRPDASPYNESFANARANHIYTIDYHPYFYATWIFSDDYGFSGIHPVDSDNGFLVFGSLEQGNSARYISGLISLKDVASPILTYYYYTWEYSNIIEMYISSDGTTWNLVDDLACDDDYKKSGNEGWIRRSVDLSKYAGKTIQWKINGICVDGMYSLIDNIYIGETHNTDVALNGISAPTTVEGGKEFTISTHISNNGIKTTPSFKINLEKDGETITTISQAALEPGAGVTAEFKTAITLGEDAEHTYRISAEVEGDEDLSNNATAEIKISRIGTIYPEPLNLTVEGGTSGATLTWEAPDLSGTKKVTVNDDMENYVDFSIGLSNTSLVNDYVGDWTMIDGDNLETYTFSGAKYPNVYNHMSFIVFNPVTLGIDIENYPTWRPSSGHKMLASFLPYEYDSSVDDYVPAEKDDWLITPLLNGDAQTIRFKARTLSTAYDYEQFEVYYSTTEPELSAMTKIGDKEECPYDWTEYEYEVAEGTKYFAIRCVGKDGFVFLVDDVTYLSGAAAGMGLKLIGYNVYRDGKLLEDGKSLTKTTYTDTTVGSGATYQVTAVYDKGESMPARATYGTGAVESGTVSDVRVTTTHETIEIHNASGKDVSVYSVDGRRVASAVPTSEYTRIAVAEGIYAVVVEGSVYKVIVK